MRERIALQREEILTKIPDEAERRKEILILREIEFKFQALLERIYDEHKFGARSRKPDRIKPEYTLSIVTRRALESISADLKSQGERIAVYI